MWGDFYCGPFSFLFHRPSIALLDRSHFFLDLSSLPFSHSCNSVPVGASLNTPCSFDDSRGGMEEGEEDGEVARPLSAGIENLSIAK